MNVYTVHRLATEIELTLKNWQLLLNVAKRLTLNSEQAPAGVIPDVAVTYIEELRAQALPASQTQN